ncbi:unnamed protein product [Parajaminaea phylloscopi]
MITSPFLRTGSLQTTAVRAFGQRSALRAPPSPVMATSTGANNAGASHTASAGSPSGPTPGQPSSAATMTTSTQSPHTGIEVGGVVHAYGTARKVGDE